MTKTEFLNALKILFSIDRWQIGLSSEKGEKFYKNQLEFTILADDETKSAIWREIEKRMTR